MLDRNLDDSRFVIDHGLAHLSAEAIANCPLCDADGYRGTRVCDHQDHAAAARRGRAACQAALEAKTARDGGAQ